jgi:uncharacterized membrane protein
MDKDYRYNPIKNKQLRIQMLSIFGIFGSFGVVSIFIGSTAWPAFFVVGIGGALFMWGMSWVMRNNL